MFKEKYIRDNDALHASEDNLDTILASAVQKPKRKTVRIVTAVAAFVLVCTAAVAGVVLFGNSDGDIVVQPSIESYSEIYDHIEARPTYGFGNSLAALMGGTGSVSMNSAISDSAVAADGGVDYGAFAEGENSTPEYSGTNTQIENVDEADIVKTDGEYIYKLTGGYVHIIKAENGQMKEVSRTFTTIAENNEDGSSVSRSPYEMYIIGDRLVLLLQEYRHYKNEDATNGKPFGYYSEQYAVVSVYDITDRSSPQLVNTHYQSGNYMSSRLIGDNLYVVSDFYLSSIGSESYLDGYVPRCGTTDSLDYVAPENISIIGDEPQCEYTVLASYNIADATAVQSVNAAFGGYETVYSNGEYILIGIRQNNTEISGEEGLERTERSSSTTLLLYRLDNGTITACAQGEIPGYLVNQFALDMHNDTLRVVTTVNRSVEQKTEAGYDYSTEQSNALYILDMNLETMGKIENVAPGERVYSVRYDGDIAYFVTFRNVDPLFSADLSDPTAPKILGELKIPGFSEYMHIYAENRLFGLGSSANEETGSVTGLKLSMFDTSDKTNLKELTTLELPDLYSEAGANHKAILINPQRGLIGFPTNEGYKLYTWSDNAGFTSLHTLDVEGVERGLFIGDYFYITEEQKIHSFSMSDYGAVDSVKLSVFAEKAE